MSKIRIDIPGSPGDIIALAKKLLAAHQAQGPNSHLNGLDMAKFQALVTEAETRHNDVVQMRKDAERETQLRNNLLGIGDGQNLNIPDTLLHFLVSARDILLGHFKGKEQKLGNYGYEVDRSPRSSSNNDDDGDSPPGPASPAA